MATAQQTSRQHLVSQVLLKQFTMSGPKGSRWQLLPFDLHNPGRVRKLTGTGACGRAENFVAFDSPSAEALWCDVERSVPAALAAVHAGTPFADPLHVAALRDLVVLHYVRSLHYRHVHTDALERARTRLVAKVISQYPEQLRRDALRETGLHLSGPASLGAFAERLIERSSVMRDHESGKLFRTSIEDTFYKMRNLASTRRLEVIMPEAGQFLIGDNPALTLSVEGSSTTYGMAFGDAQTLVLPITPRHMLSLGPEDVMLTVPQSFVDRLNAVQIHAADRYVYMHPESGLEPFVERAAQRRPAGDRTPT
ncbi:DUF4238 domain-containing protein [Streptomyces sp. WMMC940]|uniref:DUF4238 domain-containing protein n=1 Tax=Streptomyces sp. WMMC940 TaxID=3015153 RepID=UPI0022B6C5AA|nr:DUF4238 domain-containing protein [Streptomyces sp. WMMC940]MCZ7456094.1 DUF4238 domain-containing protein [Streptomyces sp. WMMC940]